MSTVGQLGERIASLAKNVEEQRLNDASAAEKQRTALELAETSRQLEQLVLGPTQTLGMMAFSVQDASSLGVIVNFDIPKFVPSEGLVSFAELSSQCRLDEDRLTRILRYAMINHIFREEPAGHVRHTPLSSHLAQSPTFCDFLRNVTVVFNPVNACLPVALSRYPQTHSLAESAHGVARQTDLPFYEWLERDENLALRRTFDKGMEGISRGGQRLQDTDLRAYPWGELPDGAVVVDMGGSGGHFARGLAAAYPTFSVVVQDLPRVIQQSVEDQKSSPGSESVTYQAHNLFDPQPVKNADVYFMRYVFHNHPDAECVKILTELLPALKQGARVLVSEGVIPPATELTGGGLATKAMRQMDLLSMAVFNSKERTKEEYSKLFQMASSALVFRDTYQVPEDPRSCIFEAVFQG
ncbi:O-methyltransferase [Apiospora saccharicola]